MGNSCCKRDAAIEPPFKDEDPDKAAESSGGSDIYSFKPSSVVPEKNRMQNVMGAVFEKVGSLGHGATSEVYEVRYKKDPGKGTFALKVMLRTAYDNAELFEHECSIMEQIDHPNVVKFYEAYEDECNLYILTEVCSGGELFDRIVKSHHFSEVKAAGLIKTILELLKTMHEVDIVHRDLKPENFVYASTEDNSALKLVDFGVAKKVKLDKVYGDIVGTAFYLAPESAAPRTRRTGRILKCSDMWSIGVITYVILTGCPPFYGRSNHAIFNSILRGRVSFKRHGHVSKGAQQFILALLKQKPDERLDAPKALQHPWIKGKAPDVAISATVVDSLKTFSKHCGLVRAFARTMVDRMNSSDKLKLEHEFKKLDMTHDGMIHAFELSSAMRHAGYTDETARREATSMLRGADINEDGTVDLVEYETARQPVLSRAVSDIRRTFKMLSEGGEFIEKDNINRVFGWDYSEEDLHEMFDEIDVDHDGKINFTDFLSVMKGGQWRMSEDDTFPNNAPSPSDGKSAEEPADNDVNSEEKDGPTGDTPVKDEELKPDAEHEPVRSIPGEGEGGGDGDGDGDDGDGHDEGPLPEVDSQDEDERKGRKESEEPPSIDLPALTEKDKIEVTSTFRYHHGMGIKPSLRYPAVS